MGHPPLLLAGLFEDLLDYVFCFVGVEQGLTLVTTEGDEVELFGLLEAFEAGGHGGTQFTSHPSQKREGWGARPGFYVASSGVSNDLRLFAHVLLMFSFASLIFFSELSRASIAAFIV
jgi:hypothetical protein